MLDQTSGECVHVDFDVSLTGSVSSVPETFRFVDIEHGDAFRSHRIWVCFEVHVNTCYEY